MPERPRARLRRAVHALLASVALLPLLTAGPYRAADESMLVTYDFEADQPGSVPAGVEVVRGDVRVVDDLLLGRSMRTTRAGAGGLAVADLTRVLGSDMSVAWRETSLPLTPSRHGFILRSTGELGGYLFLLSTPEGADPSRGSVSVYELADGAAPQLLRKASFLLKPDRWFRASAVGTELTFATSDDGRTFQRLLSVHDSDGSTTAGGLLFTSGWNGADPAAVTVDTIYVPFTSAIGSISVASPVAHQVIQRGPSGTADISISGGFRGSPSAIEARLGGGAWQVIDPAPTGESFEGVLPAQPTGQGPLEVRFADAPTVVATRTPVGVGDVFVVAGQSNAAGKAARKDAVATHPSLQGALFGNDDRWKPLADPVDSRVGQVDNVSSDASVGGSVWPAFATAAMADLGVPVAVIPTAKGGTSIADWQRNPLNPTSRTTLYGSMVRRARAAGGAKAVLFWQGETDAYVGTAAAVYRERLDAFTAGVVTDLGIPVVVAQIGDVVGSSPDALDGVRLSQSGAWKDGAALLGPAVYDVDLSDEGGDGVHFLSDADVSVAAGRWWAAVRQSLYGTGDGAGPELVSATVAASRDVVTLRFSDATLPLDPAARGGITVRLAGLPVTVLGVARTADDTVEVRTTPMPLGTVTVSIGEGRTGTGAGVPADSSASKHPAAIVVRRAAA